MTVLIFDNAGHFDFFTVTTCRTPPGTCSTGSRT